MGSCERKYNGGSMPNAVKYSLAVIARLDRATQYAVTFMMRRINDAAYWIPRLRGE